jgi:hypothetical protein
MLDWWAITHTAVMMPNQVTALDAAMTIRFHFGRPCRGASEFHRSVRLRYLP